MLWLPRNAADGKCNAEATGAWFGKSAVLQLPLTNCERLHAVVPGNAVPAAAVTVMSGDLT